MQQELIAGALFGALALSVGGGFAMGVAVGRRIPGWLRKEDKFPIFALLVGVVVGCWSSAGWIALVAGLIVGLIDRLLVGHPPKLLRVLLGWVLVAGGGLILIVPGGLYPDDAVRLAVWGAVSAVPICAGLVLLRESVQRESRASAALAVEGDNQEQKYPSAASDSAISIEITNRR